jgi:hypothetical protein
VASAQLYVNGTRDRDVELSFDEPFGLIRWDIDAIVNELLGPPQ